MNILILSRNRALYSTDSLLKAIERKGHKARIVDHMRCDLFVGNNRSEILYADKALNKVDAVIPRIGATATEFGSAVIRHFESKGIFTTLTARALLDARDKWSCLQILAANKIAIPKSAMSQSYFSMTQFPPKLGGLPIVLKKVSSTHGEGVQLAKTKTEMNIAIQQANREQQKIIIQEYIKEAQGADIRAFVVGGRVVASMKRQAREGEFRSNLHQGATAIPYELNRQEESIAIRSAQVMGLHVAGVDMLISDAGPLVLEVNASPGLEGIERATGVDVAGAIIDFVEEQLKLY